MPEGFEYHKVEVASARIESTGGCKFTVPEGQSSSARVEQTPANFLPKRVVRRSTSPVICVATAGEAAQLSIDIVAPDIG